MSDVKMSNVFYGIGDGGSCLNIKWGCNDCHTAISSERMNDSATIAINSYDSNQELIATLEREKVSLAVDLEYELSRSAKLQADIELLRDELKKVLHNLELLDEDALGQDRMHNTQPWSIRDERIHNISNLLAATAKG